MNRSLKFAVFLLLLCHIDRFAYANLQSATTPATTDIKQALIEERKRLDEKDLFADPQAILPLWQDFKERAAKTLGPQHPEVAIATSNLAVKYFFRGDVDKARDVLYESLAILTQHQQEYAAQIRVIQGNLGTLALELREGHEALRLIEPLTQNIFQNKAPDKLSDDLAMLNNLAQAQSQVGRPDLGEATNAKAIQVARKYNLIERNPTLLNNEPLYKAQQGRIASAINTARNNLAELNQYSGQEATRATASLLSSMASFLALDGKNALALNFARQAVDEYVLLFGKDAPILGRYQLTMLSLLYGQKDFDAVIDLSQTVIANLEAQSAKSFLSLQAKEYQARAHLAKTPNKKNLQALKIILDNMMSYEEGLVGVNAEGWLDYANAQRYIVSPEAAIETLEFILHAEEGKQTLGPIRVLFESELVRLEANLGQSTRVDSLLHITHQIADEYQQRLLQSGLEAQLSRYEKKVLSNAIESTILLKQSNRAFELAQLYLHSGTRVARSRARLLKDPQNQAMNSLLQQRQTLISEISLFQRQRDSANLAGFAESAESLSAQIEKKQLSLKKIQLALDAIDKSWDAKEKASAYSLQDIQAQLANKEVFIMPVLTATGMALFSADKQQINVKWHGRKVDEINKLVQNVRSSIQLSGLMRGSSEKPSYKMKSLGAFDAQSSNALFRALSDKTLIKMLDDNHLLSYVTNGSLSTIPFSTLVTHIDEKKAARFLIETNATNTLPDLSSLFSQKTEKANSFTYFVGMSSPVNLPITDNMLISETVSPSSIAFDAPVLTEAATELKSILESLKNTKTSLYLAQQATETAFKNIQTNENALIVLATHGYSNVLVNGVVEPALLFASDKQNDGLLSASEISALQVPASLIVLSACDSGGAGFGLEDGLSGLASAFLLAGADSLLVSHWPVRDDAAAYLTTNMIKARAKGLTSAEAVREAMLSYMDALEKSNSNHPALWGSFSYIGR